MKKKIMSAVVALCLVFGSAAAMPQGVFADVTSIGVSAESAATSGKCGDNVNWSLKNGVLTISGSGKMYDYNYEDSPFYCRQDITSVVIKSGVTSIGVSAFDGGCYSLESVTIPDSVTSIGEGAFFYCTSLNPVTIPSSVTAIGDKAFGYYFKSEPSDRVKIDGFTINCYKGTAGEKYAKDNGFAYEYLDSDYDIKMLDDGTAEITKYNGNGGAVTIPSTIGGLKVTRIGEQAFYDRADITSVTIPDRVEQICDWAFNGCSGIKKLTIKSGVKSIGTSAFYDCTGLTSITLPKSVTSLGMNAFAFCENLENITIPTSVISFGGSVFRDTKWLENKQAENPLVIVNGILIDGKKCTGKVTIPSTVKHINESAFDFNSNITSVKIPSSVKSIGELAFNYCKNLATVTIPSSVNTIGGHAFYGTKWLESKQKKDPIVVVNGLLIDGAKCTGSITVPSGVERVNDYAFEGNSNLTAVTIPSCVTSIADKAFYDCANLESAVFTETVKTIGEDAFAYCPKLAEIVIPSGVENIGSGALSNTGLKAVTIPKTVTQLGEKAVGYFLDVNSEIVVPGFTITGVKGTAAEKYAKDNGISFTAMLDITRFKGSGRYATAAAISQGAYPKTADTVVLANGTKFADALAGATLAHVNGAPILLTEAGRLPDETLAEIKRLGAKNVIILGGSASVGQEVKDTLDKNGLKFNIVKGKSKYATAVEIAKATKTVTEKDPTKIFFVSADKFADALSVSAVAAKKNAPIIYLPKTGSLDADTAAYLKSVKGKIKNAYVIGGSGVIGADVMTAAAKALGLTVDKNIVRVRGKTKYDTCVEVNTKFADVLNGTAICVATGEDFPDALAGGVFAAKNSAPLFLASGSLSENQKSYLKTKKAESIFVFGGSKSVPNDLVQSIATASL